MIITFLGNDGSGKTTMANELLRDFKAKGFDVFYKHEYQYVFLKFIFKIIGEKTRVKVVDKMVYQPTVSWKYQVWAAFVLFEIFLQVTYFKLFKRNTLVFLDRYIYDHYRSFDYLGVIGKNPILEWLYQHFPKPDIGIIFWVEPEIAYDRKKADHLYDLSYYEIQLEKYKELARKNKIPLINTNRSIEETKLLVLKTYFQNKNFKHKFLRHCKKNRIDSWIFDEWNLASVSDEFSTLHKFQRRRERKLIETLKFLNSIPIEKLILKTFKNFKSFSINDVDVLIHEKDLETFQEYVKNYDGKFIQISPGKCDVVLNQMFKIDLHVKLEWEGLDIFNPDFLWKDYRKVNFLGIPITIPSYEGELLLLLAHILFPNSFIRFDDFAYVNFLLKQKIDFDQIFKESSDNGWDDSLKWLLMILRRNNLKFPYFIPLSETTKSFRKKIFHDLRNKTFKMGNIKSYGLLLSLHVFWRIRYQTTGKLPFETQ